MKAILAILAIALPCLAQPPSKPAKPPDYKKLAQTRVSSVLDSISKDADFTRATKDLTSVFDELIAYAPASPTTPNLAPEYTGAIIDPTSPATEAVNNTNIFYACLGPVRFIWVFIWEKNCWPLPFATAS